MSKVLILNGSPRPKGNTHALIQEFIRGAKEAGNEVIEFDLQGMDIHGCLGCCHGGKDLSSPCVQKDDMQKIYPVYEECDILVLPSPMYYWGISGQLKCAFDRLFAVAECQKNYANPIKDAVLLMASEGADEDNFKPVRDYYQSLCRHLGWTDRGIVYAGGNLEAGAVLDKPEQLKEAFDLGRSLR